MADLISAADMLLLTDRLASMWADILPAMGTSSSTAVAGTVRATAEAMQGNLLAIMTYAPEIDMLSQSQQVIDAANAEAVSGFMIPMISALDSHCSSRGSTVDTSITSISTFLAYYSGGAGGSKFASMVTPTFNDLYYALRGSHLGLAGVMSPGLHPTLDATAYPNGMGRRAVGGSFVDGVAVDNSLYSEVIPAIEVITNFSGGTTAVTVTISGTDDQGNAASYGPTTLAGGNNPAAALAGITITPVINAHERQVVALSSTTGIIQGSVLTIDSGTTKEEVIVVEVVAGTNVTAVFHKAHSAGATVTGNTTTAAGTASTGAGRRLRDVTTITVTVGTHAAGAVRISGIQDRAPV